MTWHTIRTDNTIKYPQLLISGDVLYDPEQQALVHHDPLEGDEWLTVDLAAYGLVARPDECLVKDWSEHHGLTEALADAGVVGIVEPLTVGSFGPTVYRVLVIQQE